VLAIVITLGIANHTALAGSRVAVSLSALKMGASAFTVGALMALFALLPMLCAVSVGRISDRIGVRTPMLVGSIGVALGASISFVWTSMWALFATAMLTGVSFMMFQLSTQRVAGELGSAGDRMRNFGLLALGYSVSGFSGPLLSGFSIDHFGFPVAFAVAAVIALLPVAVLGSGRLPLPGPHPAAASPHQGGVRALLTHRALRHTYAINVLLAAGWDLHQTFVPIYGARNGLSASEIGVVLASFAAATFVIRALMPILMRRQTEHQVLTLSLYIAGIIYLLFPFSQSALTLSALSFVLGLGLGAGQPMVMSLLHTHAPASRVGEAVGVRMSLVQTSSVAVPLLFGAVGSSLGLAPVFWSVGVCLTGGGYYWRRGVIR
jgi:MFS family permease